MSRRQRGGRVIAASCLLLALAVAQPASGRVVLIGVDGGSWNLIDPGIASGALPHLARLAARGVTGNLATVEPVNSPTVWTTIATGRSPAAHGITSFYATRLALRAPTIWERLAAQGVRVGSYDWLMTWPPLELPGGFAIPGWLRRDAATSPVAVFERAGLTPYVYSNRDLRSRAEVVASIERELREKPGRFVKLLESYDVAVGAVTFYAMDASGHRFWRAAFPEQFDGPARPDDARFASVIPDALRALDDAIGQISGSLGPDDTVLVVSDHGFEADPEGARNVWVTRVAAWLAHADLEPARDAFTINPGFSRVVARVHPGPFAEREATLERLGAWLESATTEAGEPLYDVYRVDVAERPEGHERAFGEWLRQLAVRGFLWWAGALSDQPAHAWIFGVPRAGALDPLWPDGTVRVDGERWPLARLAHPDEFSGRHDPTAIFLAAGPAIRAQRERIELSVLDVAPLVFHLAGQALPDDLEGELPRAVLEPGWLERHPVRTVPAGKFTPAGGSDPEAIADGELSERLRSLGYLE